MDAKRLAYRAYGFGVDRAGARSLAAQPAAKAQHVGAEP
jgi:hypothetical protein